MATGGFPLARNADLVTEEIDGELLVFDELEQVAFRLNASAAFVWRHCDGERSIADLVALLSAELGDFVDEDMVLVALDNLADHGLIESGYEQRGSNAARLSRRRFLRRVGVTGAAAMSMPVVYSILVPTPAMAVSAYVPYYNALISDRRLKRHIKTLRGRP
jgi:hypothetical protein